MPGYSPCATSTCVLPWACAAAMPAFTERFGCSRVPGKCDSSEPFSDT